MQKINRFKTFSFFLLAAYLLAACGGTLPGSAISAGSSKVLADVVAFTGTVESINGTEWTVSGQKLTLDPHVSLDPNIAVGDEVKVEANVSADGAVVALKVESSVKDDVLATASVDASSTPDPSTNSTVSANQNEVFGAVEAMTADTITVNGATYSLTNFTEFKDVISVGDQVKLHVTVNTDGTFTVGEVEKSLASFGDNNSISGSDDGPNHDINDDHSNHSSTHSSHDGSDDHGDDHGSDDHGGSDNSGSGDD